MMSCFGVVMFRPARRDGGHGEAVARTQGRWAPTSLVYYNSTVRATPDPDRHEARSRAWALSRAHKTKTQPSKLGFQQIRVLKQNKSQM